MKNFVLVTHIPFTYNLPIIQTPLIHNSDAVIVYCFLDATFALFDSTLMHAYSK